MSTQQKYVSVKDLIIKKSVFVLHATTQDPPNFNKDDIQDLNQRLRNIIENKFPDLPLPCYTYNLISDDFYRHVFPIPPTEGVILKNGNITLAGKSDLGTDYKTKNNKGIIPKTLEDLNDIIDFHRDYYNELSVTSPRIIGYYLMTTSDLSDQLKIIKNDFKDLFGEEELKKVNNYTYSREDINKICSSLRINVYYIGPRKMYSARWENGTFIKDKTLSWGDFLELVNKV